MNYLWLILCAAAAYFIGAFNVAINISMHYAKKDIRNFGSGNAGTTNMLRTFGPVYGTVTFAADVLKGVLATFVGMLPGLCTGDEKLRLIGAMLCGIAAVVGHNWPVYYGFHGGKGIACTIGAVLMVSPVLAAVIVVVAIISILIFQYVSVASIAGTFLFGLLLALIHLDDPMLGYYTAFGVIIWFLAVISHRENIARLFAGTEKRVDLIRIFSEKHDAHENKKEEKKAGK